MSHDDKIRWSTMKSLNKNKLGFALPTIIFLDIHWISRSNEIIAQLVPELAKLGYSHFLEEIEENKSEEQLINTIGEHISYVDEIKKKISNNGLDFEKATDILKYIDDKINTLEKVHDEKIINHPQYTAIKSQQKEILNSEKKGLTNQIFDLMFKYDSYRFLQKILLAIKAHKISFEGVDLDDQDVDIKKINKYDVSAEEWARNATEIRPLRDSHMAKKYLESRTGGVFGKIGLAHIEGIYNKMLESKKPPLVFFISSPLKLKDHGFDEIAKEALESVEPLLQKALKTPGLRCVNGELTDKIVIDYILKIVTYEVFKMNFANLLSSSFTKLGLLAAASLGISAILSIFKKKSREEKKSPARQQNVTITQQSSTNAITPLINFYQRKTEQSALNTGRPQQENIKETNTLPRSRL